MAEVTGKNLDNYRHSMRCMRSMRNQEPNTGAASLLSLLIAI